MTKLSELFLFAIQPQRCISPPTWEGECLLKIAREWGQYYGGEMLYCKTGINLLYFSRLGLNRRLPSTYSQSLKAIICHISAFPRDCDLFPSLSIFHSLFFPLINWHAVTKTIRVARSAHLLLPTINDHQNL
jgi:hypothetical protein